MFKAGHKILASVVAGAFCVAVLFCCYNHPAVASEKSSCCATKHASKHSSGAECSSCPIVQKSVDVSGTFILKTVLLDAFVLYHQAGFVVQPARVMAPVFFHGPPGPFAGIPLYLRLHCLRV